MENTAVGPLRGKLSSGSLKGSLNSGSLSGDISVPLQSATTDYNALLNKPSINGVELSGNKTSQDLFIVSENTTSGWNSMPSYIPKRGEICIYTDYATIQDDMGNDIVCPGIKVGDGNAYLIDMPFVGAEIRYEILQRLKLHEENTTVHITQAEREFWNNKLNYEYDETEEILILNRN